MDINYCLLLATGFILFTNQMNLDPKYSASVCPGLRSRSDILPTLLNFPFVVSHLAIFINSGVFPLWNDSDARVTFLCPNRSHGVPACARYGATSPGYWELYWQSCFLGPP